MNIQSDRFPASARQTHDVSHAAIHVNMDACINCNLCVRACREVQVNDVIGMSFRGGESEVTFDLNDPMGASTCVGCGECVQVCPTGALIEKSLVDEAGVQNIVPDKTVNSLCPYCGVGCQIEINVKDNKIVSVDGRDGPANNFRLCVKGRFGFDYVSNDGRLTTPLIRKDGVAKDAHVQITPETIGDYFRPAT